MRKFLIFQTSDMAYESTRVFAQSLGEQLKTCGGQVDYFDIRRDTKEVLEALPNRGYDAVIDFNSGLPQLVNDEHGNVTYYLDGFHCPFLNYILDHPMYHHKNLAVPLDNYHVMTVDDTHKVYVENHYPHIRSVSAVPIGLIAPARQWKSQSELAVQWKNRQNRVLFTGTYLNPKDYLEVIHKLPEPMRSDNLKVIDGMLHHLDWTFEDIAANVLGLHETAKEFPLQVQSVCFADIYVRAHFRQEVLIALANAGVPLTIYGENYQEAAFLKGEGMDVEIYPQIPYGAFIQTVADYRYMLNVMPWFKSGIHDRVVNGMNQGCVTVTDSSRRMDEDFSRDKDYICYDLEHIGDLPAKMLFYMKAEHVENAVEIAFSGNEKIQKYSFMEAAKELLWKIK